MSEWPAYRPEVTSAIIERIGYLAASTAAAPPAEMGIQQPQTSKWLWAVVTQRDPLRIRLDTDPVALPLTPDSLVRGLQVNQRVRVQFVDGDVIVYGVAGDAAWTRDPIQLTASNFNGLAAPGGVSPGDDWGIMRDGHAVTLFMRIVSQQARTGDPATATNPGNFSDLPIGSITDSWYRPVANVHFMMTVNGTKTAFGRIYDSGAMTMTHTYTDGKVLVGDAWDIYASWWAR